MDNKLSVAELPINASPAAVHRQQMLKQVWLPLGIVIVIALALMILAIVGAIQGSSQIERWGNLSAVIVILPVLLVSFLLLVIVGASVYGMSKLLKKMPGWMLRLQLFAARLSLTVRRASDSATRPIFFVNNISARARALWRKTIGSL